ncbi:uncharacterized protein EAF02_000212 [Botrytis sinoallii]|uniref:uncharacterized protein n=1 Tax=Botrytis sinoallii TaxID=1463999 RepID=UPI001900B257|nr:uncharacterized protein EAF02_000212 [Botrytis sinoallii]KAF7892674.1 hypothetical protein EAF02_000212 [Botrytis sinoallii]
MRNIIHNLIALYLQNNSIVLQTYIKQFLKKPFFHNTKLVLLGDCNSTTIVAYRAMIRAVTSHANIPQADIVNNYIINKNGKMKKEKQEFFDEKGSVANQVTDYKIPIIVFICSSLNSSQVINNDEDNIANSGSTRPKIEKTNFEIDFSSSIPNPLFITSELIPVNGFYNVNWAIFAETIGIGIDFWCAVNSNDQDLNNSNDIPINMRMVYRVLYTDLVGVIQQSYAVDNDGTVEQNDEDNKAIPKGMEEKEKETDNDNDNDNGKRNIEQLNFENEALFPGLITPCATSSLLPSIIQRQHRYQIAANDRDLSN